MSLPPPLAGRLAMPAVVAPMFLVSGPALVIACCRAGLLGTVPALNQRSTAGLAAWLDEIGGALGPSDAPFGVNLIVHRSNPRLADDLDLVVRHRVPLVITSLGAVRNVVEAVHGYGGLVFHDVVGTRHARKAAEAGVDGLIAVCAGAGGHAGTLSPFALVSEIRRFFDGTVVLAGALSRGSHVAAAELIGADLGYFGSLFIAAEESMASAAQKAMLVEAEAGDIVHTDRVTGVLANFLRRSLAANGLLDAAAGPAGPLDVMGEAKAWRDVWSAGQGVGAIEAVRPARAICADLIADYHRARALAPA